MMTKKAQIPPPEGFRYQADVLPLAEEQDLVEQLRELPLKEFEFHGFTGKRRVIYFGWRYDFSDGKLEQTEPIPVFLHGLREKAASFAGLTTADLAHALLTEYGPGVTIGWHRDRGVFGDVVGISLLSSCNFRFRRKAGSVWQRYSLTAEPRSVYLLRGEARTEWEHSIPAVDELRYSITFRTLRGRK